MDKRKYLRMQSQRDPCVITVDGVTFEGSVADESISGAKIVNLDLLMMPHNKQLSLTNRGASISVNARNASRAENGKFQLGVIRTELLEDESADDAPAMLINCYVQHGDACVICMPIHIESEEQIVIQLWDGVQFRVPRTQLRPMSRPERFEMLADPHSLEYTVAMYGFQSASPADDRRQVFDYEFGSYYDCPVTNMASAQ